MQAFNYKMGAKQKISKHPNPYVLVDEIKTQLKDGCDTAVAETVTSHTKKVNKKLAGQRKLKAGLMKDLAKRNIDLETYIVSMGVNTLKYQPQIQSETDPLVDIDGLSDLEENLDDAGLDSDNSLDEDDPEEPVVAEPPTSSAPPTQPSRPGPQVAEPPTSSAPPTQPSRPRPPVSRSSAASKAASKAAHNKKGKKRHQKPIPESEESFVHVESLADIDVPAQASIGGDNLRQFRRQQAAEDPEPDDSTAFFSATALASAGATVLSRFLSRSSASKSPRRSSVGRRMSRGTSSVSSNPTSPARSDPSSSAKQRVESLGFRFSSSQPFTKGDGNCMLYAIWDQLGKCSHHILQVLKSPHDLRLYVCSKLVEQLEQNQIFWVQNFSPESWLAKMKTDHYWCDDVFLQIVSNIFNKNIILIPLSPSSAHHAGMYLDLRAVGGGSGEPFFMLYFEEWRTAGHYQSLEPDPNVRYNLVIAHFNWRTNNLTTSRSSANESSTAVSTSASSPAHPGPAPASAVPTSAPSAPTSSPTASTDSTSVPFARPSASSAASQLHSTRQRIESDGNISFTQILSPISSRDVQAEVSSNQSGQLILSVCLFVC